MPRRSSGGKWSRSLFTYTRSGIEHCSATSSFQAASDDAKDFLAFLSVAQSLNVDFLPLTWPPALDAIGEGATAKIRQATISLGASLAFKCPKARSDWEDGDNYRALIAEISVLRCPPVRGHPNIARLEGIWFDIDVENSKARPVLVTEKAPHGDLFGFMTLGEGSELSLKSRLGLCHDVALAIRIMHQNRMCASSNSTPSS